MISDEFSCDVLLIVATDLERNILLERAEERTGSTYRRFYGKRRTYYDLGHLGGARLVMVQCEMGAGAPGAAQATTSDAIDELSPDCAVMLGIAFGIDPSTQNLGQILVSRQLKPYELQRVGTGKDGELTIVSRGDRITASPKLIGRLRSAT